ncbi:MAG: Ig-like domain-containing protein [Candidatus Eiseniibacteriota bacterium]
MRQGRLRAARDLAAAACIAGVAATAGLWGCARSVFPPGGPIDTTAPRVAFSDPADSSVRVPVDASVELLFSESMDRPTVRDGIRIFPPAGRQLTDWSGRRVRVTWAKPLAEGTTYTLLLSGTARDARGVPLGRATTLRFSTGDSLDRGQISGRLRAKTLRRAGVPIVLFPDSLGDRPDTTGAPVSYATETDSGGVYHVTGLPVGRGFTVHAFYDQNNNGSLEADVDYVFSYAGPIRLTSESPEADSVNIVAVDPKAPAIIKGTVATVDSTARFRIEAVGVDDSTNFKRVERIGPGAFSIRVSAGTYRLRAVPIPTAGGMPEGPVIRRDEPIEAKPEEEYGPFELDFGSYQGPKREKPAEGEEE